MGQVTVAFAPTQTEIRVEAAAGETHTTGDIEELLGLILAQALTDGMDTLVLAADPSTQRVSLTYGRTHDGQPETWEMTPPPAEIYAALVQVLVRWARITPGPTGTGRFSLCHGETRCTVELYVTSPQRVSIALTREGPGPQQPQRS